MRRGYCSDKIYGKTQIKSSIKGMRTETFTMPCSMRQMIKGRMYLSGINCNAKKAYERMAATK